jgi:hypothetical protein
LLLNGRSLASASEIDVDNRASVLRYLRSLGDKDLLETFYDAVRGRSTGDIAEAKDHYVIAHVAAEDGRWDLDVIAREDPAHYPTGFASDVPVCQWGVCDGCGAQVRSWAKYMLCPVCGGTAHGS